MEYVHFFQNLESFLRTQRTGEDDKKSILQKHNIAFQTHEIHPGIYEVCDNITILEGVIKTKVPLIILP